VDAGAPEFSPVLFRVVVEQDAGLPRESLGNDTHIFGPKFPVVFDEDQVRLAIKLADISKGRIRKAEEVAFDIISHNVLKLAQRIDAVRYHKAVENLRHCPLIRRYTPPYRI